LESASTKATLNYTSAPGNRQMVNGELAKR
jgi:hypothetical protein